MRGVIKHLYVEYLKDVANKWFEIGVVLGLPLSTLEPIGEKDEMKDRMMAVIEVR